MKAWFPIPILLCLQALAIHGEEIGGSVRSSTEKYATIVTQSKQMPSPGDKAEIYFTIPGGDDVVSVAQGHVFEITGENIVVQIDSATGKVAKDQLVKFHSTKPANTAGDGSRPSPFGILSAEIDRVRNEAHRTTSKNNLKQIGLAIVVYNEHFRRLPYDIRSPEGKPLLSWRVALLPYLEQQSLYEQFKLDEPWDSTHNRALLSRIPVPYAAPGAADNSTGSTYYQRFVGPGTVFEGDQKRRISEIPDGLSQTLLAAEAGTPVPWTKPEDLTYDPNKPPPPLGGLFSGGWHGLFADASVRYFSEAIGDKTLRALITRDGKETIPPDVLRNESGAAKR